MAFHDVIFPEDYSQGAVGGPEFRTTVVTTGSGYEQRNVDWLSARCRFDLSRLLYDPATRDATISFFRNRQGRAHSFLFKDWGDYFVGMTWNTVTKTLDHSTPHQIGTGTGALTTFQISKTYTSGSFTQTRKITRPKSGFRIYLNGVQQVTGFTVNTSTGIVTFTTAPGAGVAVQWSGEFYVPVRFDVDALSIEYISPTAGDVPLPVIEVRE